MPLKPADVGRRVVVRSLVRGETGPSGGPALTDTLGRLERWDSDVLSVRKADGTLVRIPLADVVGVARTMDVTVNDAVLAAVSGAFRALLLRRGEEPGAGAIRTLVPVSVRAKDQEGTIDNRISMMLPMLPIEVADPLDRLAEVHRRLNELKASKEADAGQALTALARHEPFAPISLGIRLAARLPHRNIVTVTTNVPGPRRRLYALGRQIVEILPYVPIAVRLRTGVSVLTYQGQMAFGVTCDYDNGPDADELAAEIAGQCTELVHAVRALAR